MRRRRRWHQRLRILSRDFQSPSVYSRSFYCWDRASPRATDRKFVRTNEFFFVLTEDDWLCLLQTPARLVRCWRGLSSWSFRMSERGLRRSLGLLSMGRRKTMCVCVCVCESRHTSVAPGPSREQQSTAKGGGCLDEKCGTNYCIRIGCFVLSSPDFFTSFGRSGPRRVACVGWFDGSPALS